MIILAKVTANTAPAAPPIAEITAGEWVGVQNCRPSKINAKTVKVVPTKKGRGQPMQTIKAATKYPKKCSRNQWPVRKRSNSGGSIRVTKMTIATAITPRRRYHPSRELVSMKTWQLQQTLAHLTLNSPDSLATFTAMRRASSKVSTVAS